MTSEEVRIEHAMAKLEDDWEPEDELVSRPNVPQWDFEGPLGILRCAYAHRYHRSVQSRPRSVAGTLT